MSSDRPSPFDYVTMPCGQRIFMPVGSSHIVYPDYTPKDLKYTSDVVTYIKVIENRITVSIHKFPGLTPDQVDANLAIARKKRREAYENRNV